MSSRVVRTLAAVVGVIAVGAATTGCQSAQNAVDNAQQLAEQGNSLLQATTDIAAACTTAEVAWAPGVSTKEARAAIVEATDLAKEAVAANPDVPGADTVLDLLTTAMKSLKADPSAETLGISQSSLETACAVFTSGG